MPERALPAQSERPIAFSAWEDTAAYVDGSLTRSRAITVARDHCALTLEDWRRDELRSSRVYMRQIEGEEAEEFFGDAFRAGWIETGARHFDNGDPEVFPMWKVEPR